MRDSIRERLKPMRKPFQFPHFFWQQLMPAVCGVFMGLAQAAGADNNSAALLHTKYAQLGPQLSVNQFMRPLVLDSAESPQQLNGDIYARIDFPFAAVSEALTNPDHWCDVMILPPNTKYCHASTQQTRSRLMVSVGKKSFQTLEEAYSVEFSYRVLTTTPDYFDVALDAKTGPLGTRDYRILLEAQSLPDGKTFLHLTYSYTYDFAGQIAMQVYLATLGRGKVGFTITNLRTGLPPDYIDGVRGVLERNTMRYYLAIEAYLGALSSPLAEQFEKRLQNWFAATEQYPRQLHEVSRADYFDIKRQEYLRMQKPP